MRKQSFQIVMQTPIGERCGTMTVEWKGEEICGYMELLGHTEPFTGCIDESGSCRIEGRLISLTRTIPYVAVGTISPAALSLSLQEERNIFEVYGTPCTENGGVRT